MCYNLSVMLSSAPLEGGAQTPEAASVPLGPPVLVPSKSQFPFFRSSIPLTPVVCDDRAIGRLLEEILKKSNMTTKGLARILGVTPATVRECIKGERPLMSLKKFLRIVEACGGRVRIELP